MKDLTSPRLIILKGFLMLFCGAFAAALLLWEFPAGRVALLLGIAVWGFCRFYYFAFYVIEHYVDGKFRFAGLWDFFCYLVRRSRQGVGITTTDMSESGNAVLKKRSD